MAARPFRLTVSVLMALSVACAKSEPPKAESAATPAPPTGPNVVQVTAKDYVFTMPDTIPGGLTTIQLHNEGPSLHHFQLMRLEQGKTMADVAKLSPNGPAPDWIVSAGGPNTPIPGGISEGTLDLTPGNYILACMIPAPDGQPHMMKGMVHALTVVPSDVQRVMPEPDVTVTLSDYSFALSTPLTAGKHLIRVDNAAPQPHELFIIRLDPGKTPADVAKYTEKMVGPPPGMPMGGVTGIGPGGHNFFSVELTPGEYGIMCFLPDSKDGKPHFMHGMMQQVTVQ